MYVQFTSRVPLFKGYNVSLADLHNLSGMTSAYQIVTDLPSVKKQFLSLLSDEIFYYNYNFLSDKNLKSELEFFLMVTLTKNSE